MTTTSLNIFWFRRDLRLEDNRGLMEALQGSLPVLPIFIYDKNILDKLPENDSRVTFIHQQVNRLKHRLEKEYSSTMGVFYGKPEEIFRKLILKYEVESVYTNHDYEPYAERRDDRVFDVLEQEYVEFNTYKDQVIFERNEVVKDNGEPYVVYTPFKNRWKDRLKKHPVEQFNTLDFTGNLLKTKPFPDLGFDDIGFRPSSIQVPKYDISSGLIDQYNDLRDFPAKESTSRIGPHLRFGTISIREAVLKASGSTSPTYLDELIWREFFMQILWHFPKTLEQSFKPKYDRILWRNNEEEFEKWCSGNTGFPLVDAGMRELNATGFMHNRVRMLVGSFLCKHLLIDWRWGEAYFAEKLLDYEMSSNVGNWQWVAGCGVDAAPYFRIFNPTTQIKKFDKDRDYIKKWVPEVDTDKYPEPMVDHKEARERCLSVYKAALDG